MSERSRSSKAKALSTFQNLMKIDALLFYADDILRVVDLKDVAKLVERARQKVVLRLAVYQDVAYGQMQLRSSASRAVPPPAKRKKGTQRI